MRYSEAQYNQKYQSLTQKQQEYIGSENVDGSLAEISIIFKLTLEQRKNLAAEVAYALIGLEPLTKFIDNIKQYAGLDEGTALKITKELEREVFIPFEDLNLPATKEEGPEREVSVRKIITPNPILNKQLEVPYSTAPAAKPATPPKLGGDGEVPSIIGARLSGSFNMPKEEVKIDTPKPQTPHNLPTGTPAEQKKYTGKDPYREPLE